MPGGARTISSQSTGAAAAARAATARGGGGRDYNTPSAPPSAPAARMSIANNNSGDSNMELVDTFPLYSEECLVMLRQALTNARSLLLRERERGTIPATTNYFSSATSSRKSRYADSSSSSSEEEQEDQNDPSSAGDGTNGQEEEEEESEDEELSPSEHKNGQGDENNEQQFNHQVQQRQPKKASRGGGGTVSQRQRKLQQAVRKHVENLAMTRLDVPPPPQDKNGEQGDILGSSVLEVPRSLLSKEDQRSHLNVDCDEVDGGGSSGSGKHNGSSSVVALCQSFATLSASLVEQERPVMVLMLRSGRFAGAVFCKETCLAHSTLQAYTVRGKQGKAQSAQDGQRKVKSVGSQLRRAGEQKLKEDLAAKLAEWKDWIRRAALIFISAPKTMRQQLFVNEGGGGVLAKDDPRIRRAPLDLGKPTFEQVQVLYQVMMTATVRRHEQHQSVAPAAPPAPAPAGSSPKFGCGLQEEQQEEENGTTTKETRTSETTTTGAPAAPAEQEETTTTTTTTTNILALTAVHLAARDGDLETLTNLIGSTCCSRKTTTTTTNTGEEERTDEEGHCEAVCVVDEINKPAGPDLMTPLHYAAESCSGQQQQDAEQNEEDVVAAKATGSTASPDTAAEMVYALLVRGRANPCLPDGRSRPPYFLAGHEKVRRAFRRARAALGEDAWDWDAEAKVPAALTDEDVQRKKEKEAAKKRNKRARQKEKKQKEKAERAAAEERLQQQEAEERRKREEEASRPAGPVCDYCRKVCKGKRRNELFHRLDFIYCTTDCVQKHKRELMAAAAMARFSGSNNGGNNGGNS